MSIIYVPMTRFDDTHYVLCTPQAVIRGWRIRFDAKAHYDAEFSRALRRGRDTQLAAFYAECYLRVVPIDDVVLFNLIHTPFMIERVELMYGHFIGIPVLKEKETAAMLWTMGLPVRGTEDQDKYWRDREELFASEVRGPIGPVPAA